MAAPVLQNTKYKLSADIKKGEHHVLYIYGKPIAYLKENALSLKTDTEDLATKFSGRFDDKLGGKTSYSISCEALVSNTPGHMSATALRHLSYTGEAHPFEVCVTEVQSNADGSKQIKKGDVVYKGTAIITEVGEKSEKGSYETVSISLEGSGALFDAAGKEYGDATLVAPIKAPAN